MWLQYTGRLQATGKEFDKSKGKGFAFRLGAPGAPCTALQAQKSV